MPACLNPMKADANPAVTLLAIDDEPQILELITASLEQKGLHILTASDPLEGLRIFLEERPRIVLCDLLMPNMNGMQVLEKIVAVDPGTEVILMTAHYSTDSAVEAIQRGACDYLTKPLSMEKLQLHIRQLLDQAEKCSHALQLERELLETYQFKGIVGRSPVILDVFTKVQLVAPHFRGVLVSGATGSVK